jgi:autonomous glycyl radical cofactor GrcA
MTNASIAGQHFSFEATLENWAEGMDYCAIPVPAKITQALGTHAAVAVTARLNESAPFAVSLFPVGGGQHYIRIKAKVRKETGTKVGDGVLMRITVVDRAAVANPADLRSALKAAGVTNEFNALTPGRRSFIIRRIEEAAKPETRRKRIQEAVSEAQKRRGRPSAWRPAS